MNGHENPAPRGTGICCLVEESAAHEQHQDAQDVGFVPVRQCPVGNYCFRQRVNYVKLNSMYKKCINLVQPQLEGADSAGGNGKGRWPRYQAITGCLKPPTFGNLTLLDVLASDRRARAPLIAGVGAILLRMPHAVLVATYPQRLLDIKGMGKRRNWMITGHKDFIWIYTLKRNFETVYSWRW